jgi:hypothetical protein
MTLETIAPISDNPIVILSAWQADPPGPSRIMAIPPKATPRRGARPGDLIAERGVYLFTENGRHLYVGRSNRLFERYKNHWGPNKTEREAAFAFKLAREETGFVNASYKKGPGSRKDLMLVDMLGRLLRPNDIPSSGFSLWRSRTQFESSSSLLRIMILTLTERDAGSSAQEMDDISRILISEQPSVAGSRMAS